jgi:hypothetical protein
MAQSFDPRVYAYDLKEMFPQYDENNLESINKQGLLLIHEYDLWRDNPKKYHHMLRQKSIHALETALEMLERQQYILKTWNKISINYPQYDKHTETTVKRLIGVIYDHHDGDVRNAKVVQLINQYSPRNKISMGSGLGAEENKRIAMMEELDRRRGLRKMYHPKQQGKGVMDFIRDPKKAVRDARYAVIGATDPLKKTVEGVIYGPQDHAPYVRKIIDQYGDKKIVRAMAHRKPVDKPLTSALNVVSLGQFAKQNNYDDLFHLSLVLFFEDGTPISIEKIENINMVINPPTHAKAETQEIGNFHPVTLNELIDGAKKVLGDKYFKYDASSNNCQAYIMALLKGSGLGTAENYKFIKQDTEAIFKGLDKTLALSNALTDLGARASVIRYGGKMTMVRGVVKRV